MVQVLIAKRNIRSTPRTDHKLKKSFAVIKRPSTPAVRPPHPSTTCKGQQADDPSQTFAMDPIKVIPLPPHNPLPRHAKKRLEIRIQTVLNLFPDDQHPFRVIEQRVRDASMLKQPLRSSEVPKWALRLYGAKLQWAQPRQGCDHTPPASPIK
jgi:hypothetical protein